MNWILLIILINSIYVLLLTLSNTVYLALASKSPAICNGAFVSVCVPARNETKNLRRCLESLACQSYSSYEVLVYDDDSSDDTLAIAKEFEKIHPHFKVFEGHGPPSEWYGKPYAMYQLSVRAAGEILLFTDADTVHSQDSVAWVATNMEKHRADMISAYPRHLTGSFGSKLVMPNIYVITALLVPLWLIPKGTNPLFSHAIGQYLAFRSASYREAGGHAAVKGFISEDIFMARHMKRSGFRCLFLDAKTYVSCFMYEDAREAIDGVAKNIFDFFEKKLYPILILNVYVFLLLLSPIFLLLFLGHIHNVLLLAGLSHTLLSISWMLLLYPRKMPWYLPLIFPVLLVCILFAAWVSVARSTSGAGHRGKGRIVR